MRLFIGLRLQFVSKPLVGCVRYTGIVILLKCGAPECYSVTGIILGATSIVARVWRVRGSTCIFLWSGYVRYSWRNSPPNYCLCCCCNTWYIIRSRDVQPTRRPSTYPYDRSHLRTVFVLQMRGACRAFVLRVVPVVWAWRWSSSRR